MIDLPPDVLRGLRFGDRIEFGPFSGDKLHPAARGRRELLGYRRTKSRASKPNLLIGCSVTSAASSWVEAKIEDGAGFFSGGAIFGQITARLPHHPDRRDLLALTVQHIEQGLFTDALTTGLPSNLES